MIETKMLLLILFLGFAGSVFYMYAAYKNCNSWKMVSATLYICGFATALTLPRLFLIAGLLLAIGVVAQFAGTVGRTRMP